VSRHRLEPRPRYGRIAVLASSLVVTGVAVLGGIGLLPQDASPKAAGSEAADAGIAQQVAAPEQSTATRRPGEPVSWTSRMVIRSP